MICHTIRLNKNSTEKLYKWVELNGHDELRDAVDIPLSLNRAGIVLHDRTIFYQRDDFNRWGFFGFDEEGRPVELDSFYRTCAMVVAILISYDVNTGKTRVSLKSAGIEDNDQTFLDIALHLTGQFHLSVKWLRRLCNPLHRAKMIRYRRPREKGE